MAVGSAFHRERPSNCFSDLLIDRLDERAIEVRRLSSSTRFSFTDFQVGETMSRSAASPTIERCLRRPGE